MEPALQSLDEAKDVVERAGRMVDERIFVPLGGKVTVVSVVVSVGVPVTTSAVMSVSVYTLPPPLVPTPGSTTDTKIVPAGK